MGEDEDTFNDWVKANGLTEPRDFAFAFASADEARATAGGAAAKRWTELQGTTSCLPPS